MPGRQLPVGGAREMAQDQPGKRPGTRLADALSAKAEEIRAAAGAPDVPAGSPPGLGGLPRFQAGAAGGKAPPPLPRAAGAAASLPMPSFLRTESEKAAKPSDPPPLVVEPPSVGTVRAVAPLAPETPGPEAKPLAELGQPTAGAPALPELAKAAGAQSAAPAPALGQATRNVPEPPTLESGGEPAGNSEQRTEAASRRKARRRPAGGVAANDDVPSIGGLIYALEQRPAKRPYVIAASMTGAWLAIGGFFAWGMLAPEIARSASFAELIGRPAVLTTLATIVLPIAVFWFLAWLLYQAQDLRLRSSAMTEVAIRLAEPDRAAEQSIASLGQSVRKQVNFMNDAISRAMNRAGELEAMVQNEVAQLEQAYKANETRIKGLLGELVRERNELSSTSTDMHTTLRAIGSEVPALIEKLNSQQVKLAKIIEGAGQNLISLETSLNSATGRLETSLGERTSHLEGVLTSSTGQVQNLMVDRTNHLQTVLDEYTGALNTTLGSRTGQMQTVLDEYTKAIDQALGSRAEQMQTVFANYSSALDATLQSRTQALDNQLVERTQALDNAFAQRLVALDDSMRQSALLIDGTIGDKARMLSVAMEQHARQLADTLGRQASNLDETLVHGINAVRRTSENITRQSVKAIEGLAGQADMLKNVSENLLTQIGSVTTRFENQGQSIMRAANALESANYRIDQTLQSRQRELADTLSRLSGASEQVGQQLLTYRANLDTSIADAQARTRQLTEEMARGAKTHAEAAMDELERLKSETASQTSRAMDDLRSHMSTVSREVSSQVGSLSSRLNETTQELRSRAERAATDFAREQERLRADAARLPDAARESTEAMRRVLNEQMRALEQLTAMASREAQGRGLTPPSAQQPSDPPAPAGQAPSLAASIAAQPQGRTLSHYVSPGPLPPPPQMGGPTPYASQGPIPSVPPQPAHGAPSQPTSQASPPYAQHAYHSAPQPAPQHQHVQAPAAQSQAEGAGSNWSFGKLLARASKDEPRPQMVVEAAAPAPAPINLESIARALDPATASAIWSRFRAGQRGIMVRSIYSAEGRGIFDEVTRRYQAEAEFRSMVDRFLGDFEVMLRDCEQRDPSGRQLDSHLQSGSGRVYLFLAHASGRLV